MNESPTQEGRAGTNRRKEAGEEEEELPLEDCDEWMEFLARNAEKLVRAEMGELHLDRCWISGRHAGQAQEPLSRKFGLGVQLLDPISRVDCGSQELDDPAVFATATGLAMRGLSGS